MGHILHMGIRCFRAIRVGRNKYSCPIRQICKVKTLLSKSLKASVLPWGALLDHNDRGTIQSFLPGVVQQLKLPPRVNTYHFLCPTVDVSPYFNGPKANK